MELIALLSSGQGTWAQVSGLMNHNDWDKIVVVGDESGKAFKNEKKFEFIKVDFTKKLIELRDELKTKLKGKFGDMEVSVSIASGNGKEHMALISALINLPVGVRFCALTREGVVYI